MTTTTRTECETRDQIACWDEVREGDLVLHGDHMCELTAWMLDVNVPDKFVVVRFDCEDRWSTFARHWPVAVRRYAEYPAGEG